MKWLERKIIAPLDRRIQKVEDWWKGAPVQKKAFACFCALIFLGLVIEIVK